MDTILFFLMYWYGISVQFKWFIYAQITAHDVHYKFEVMDGDVSL